MRLGLVWYLNAFMAGMLLMFIYQDIPKKNWWDDLPLSHHVEDRRWEGKYTGLNGNIPYHGTWEH